MDIKGKGDGITADAGRHLLIATVNEDANSSIYTIRPGAPASAQIRHYRYSKPLAAQGSDMSGGAIDMVTGRFPARAVFVAVTPCDAGNAPATCPAPGFPANYWAR